MSKINKLYVYTDGGSRGNPGPSAVGVIFFNENRNILKQHSEFIGENTNNQAEYRALIRGLELATAYCRNEIICFLDSELVINQLHGSYRIKNDQLRDLFYTLKNREQAFNKVVYNHVRRTNRYIMMADRLVNRALDQY